MPVTGFVGRVMPGRIVGWALQPDAPDWNVEILVHLGSDLIGQQKAAIYRQDLKNAGYGKGDHGFDVSLGRKISQADLSRLTVTAVGKDTVRQSLPAVGRWFEPTETAPAAEEETKPGGYSQGGEDLVLERIFRNVPIGTYVDVGSNYPIHHNNTYLLYRKGWSGLCIDPHASLAPLYARDRPRDTFVPLAVSSRGAEVVLHYGDTLRASSLHPGGALNVKSMTVPSKPLTTILREHNVPAQFEVLSIDVEGAEQEVLDSLDFRAFRPRVVIVEYNRFGKISLDLQSRLVSNHYHIIAVTRWNFIATANFAEDWQTYPEGFRMFEDAPAAQPPAPAAPTSAPAPARMPSSVEVVIQRLGHKCRGTIGTSAANHGSEIISYRAPAGLHWAVMVEPNPEPFRRLQAAIGNTPNYLAIPALCAASAGVEHDFHVDPGGGQASSMLRPSGVLTMAPQVKFEKPIKLVSTTVDLIMAQLAASQPGFSIDAIDILSIDVHKAPNFQGSAEGRHQDAAYRQVRFLRGQLRRDLRWRCLHRSPAGIPAWLWVPVELDRYQPLELGRRAVHPAVAKAATPSIASDRGVRASSRPSRARRTTSRLAAPIRCTGAAARKRTLPHCPPFIVRRSARN